MAIAPQHRGPENKPCAHCGAAFYRDKRCTWVHWLGARFCSRECNAAAWAKTSAARREPMERRFWRYVQKSDGCWEWTWLKDKNGYGLFPYAGKQYRAHSLALKFDHRPTTPERPMACHTCDNPACVNPAHLYPGTAQDNSDDASARGRRPVGERNHFAKLTETDVRAIRIAAGTQNEIAARFGVTRGLIAQIRLGKIWKHVK
jgi:hypothetical protein